MADNTTVQCDFYRNCFDYIFSSIIICDKEGNIIAVNPSAKCLFQKELFNPNNPINIYDLIAGHEKNVLDNIIESGLNFSGSCPDYKPQDLQFITGSGKTILTNTFASLNSEEHIVFTITDISEPKKAEAIAKEREKQLLDLTNNLHGVVYQFIYAPNKKPDFLYVSDGVYDVYEITPEGLKQDPMSVQKILAGEDKNIVAKAALEAFLEKKTCEIQYQIKTKSGKKKWIYAVANPHRMSDGKLIWTGYSMDITEQKQAQEKLKDSEQRLRIHTQFSPLAFIEWDNDIYVRDWNIAAEKIFGFSREEVLGKHAFDLIVPPELFSETREVWDKLLKQIGGYKAAARCINKAGNYVYCEWYNTPLFDEKGNIIGVTSMVLDVTKRKLAEDALKESEQRFKNIAEVASDWIWETDAEGRFSYVSDRYSKVIGIPAEKVVGKHLRDMYVSDDPRKKKEWLQAVDDILNHKGFWDYEFQVDIAGQRSRWFRISGAPFFDRHGSYLGHRGTGSDTTEQRTAENALIASEEKFRHIAETTYDWFWETDSNDCFTYVSESFLQSLKMEKQDVIGRHVKDMLAVSRNDHIKSWYKFLEDIDARKAFSDYEYLTPAKDENQQWFKVSGAPYYGNYGEYLGFRGAGVDITTEKHVLLEQEKCHQRMLELVGLMGVVVWETDQQLNIKLLSENFEDVIACDKQKFMSRNVKELFIDEPSDISIRDEIISRRSFTDLVVTVPIIEVDNDKTNMLKVSGKPYYDSAHEFLGYRGIIKSVEKV